MMDEPLYLFCVAEGGEAPRPGAGLWTVSVDGLHAVVRPVDPAAFALAAGGGLSPALEELLVGHDQVIREVFATHNLLPMRFGVAVAGTAALERYLREQAAALRGALSRVRGCAEWGVRWDAPAQPVVASAVAVPLESGSGYLRRRQSEAQARQRAGAEFRRLAESGHQALKALAAESQVDPAPGAGRFGAVYLVPHAAGDDFLATADAHSAALTALGAGLRVTGPWPPYSFCSGISPVQ